MVCRAPRWGLLCVALSVAAGACGIGTAGVVAGTSGGSGGNAATVGSELSVTSSSGPGRAAGSPAEIHFLLTDQEGDVSSVGVSYALGPGLDESDFEPITLAAGSAPLVGIPAGQYVVLWDFAADLPTREEYRDDVAVRLDVIGGISPPALEGVAVGNQPPEILSAGRFTEGEASGNVAFRFQVADPAADPADVVVEYDVQGDVPDQGWRLARSPSTPPEEETESPSVAAAATSEAGETATFVWDSAFDLRGVEVDVVVRFVPDDNLVNGTGAAVEAAPFRVDNNAPPLADLEDGLLALNPDERRGIPVPFRLVDTESDDVRVVLQWRRANAPFPSPDLSALSREELLALVDDPARDDERRRLQICAQQPLVYTGRIQPGASATEVALPELAGSAASLLVRGMAGRTIEILRASPVPEPVASTWQANPLEGPVAVLPVGEGPTALVLDHPGGRSWRLAEIDLATGRLASRLGAPGGVTTAIGDPCALAWEPGRRSVLVASVLGEVWHVHRVDLDGWRATPLVSAFDGATARGRVRGLVSLGTKVALITVEDALIRLDFGADSPARATTLLEGLAGPWGLAVDALLPNRIWLAERDFRRDDGGVGRVVTVDLDTYAIRAVHTDPATAPGRGLERPTAIALERSGRTLLALTDANPADGTRELRALGIGGRDAGAVAELSADLPAGTASLALGARGQRMLALPGNDDLAVAGGVLQRRDLVDDPALAYDPRRLTATVTEPCDPPLPAGALWCIADRLKLAPASPAGVSSVFVWDSTEVPEGDVHLRIVPLDTDVGLGDEGLAPKRVRTFLDPLFLDASSPNIGPVADLNGDGRLDVVISYFVDERIAIHYQQAPGVFPSTPDVLLDASDGTGLRAGPVGGVAADFDDDDRLDIAVSLQEEDVTLLFLQPTSGFASASRDCAVGDPLTSELVGGMTAADLDRDGRPELVVASQQEELGFSIFHPGSDPSCPFPGRPSLEFAPPLPGESRLLQVASGDLDGDGLLDLVGAFSAFPFPPGAGSLLVYRQSSTGTFLLDPRSPPTATQPFAIRLLDLNGDGRLDLATTTRNADGMGGTRSGPPPHTISAYFQRVPGEFPAVPDVQLEDPVLEDPSAVTAGDVNGDGLVDLISNNFESDTVTGFLQVSPGRFRSVPDVVVGGPGFWSRPSGVALADLDGNGRLDLIATAEQSDTAAIFLQDAPGGFSAQPDLELGTAASTDRPVGLDAADLDGDGVVDLVSANADSDTLTLFHGDSAGRFVEVPDVELSAPGLLDNPKEPVAADLDGDGDLDLVSANPDSNNLCLFLQTASRVYAPQPVLFESGSITTSVVAADVDLDGRLDLVATPRDLNRTVVFLQPDTGFAGGPFQPQIVLGTNAGTRAPRSVCAADLDADGLPDLTSANFDSGTLTIFFQPAGGFPFRVRDADCILGDTTTNRGPQWVVASDLNGDGRLDLASANEIAGTVRVFHQPRLGFESTTSPDVDLTNLGRPRALEAADLDVDGLTDLAVANRSGGDVDVAIYYQGVGGRFPSVPDRVLGGPGIFEGAVSIVAADLNGDGEPDLATGVDRPFSGFGDFDVIAVFFGGK